MSYITIAEYREVYSNSVLDSEIEALIQRASAIIDIATNFKIQISGGIEYMPPFAQKQIKQATLLQTEFTRLYGDFISSPLSSYGINGISINLDSSKFFAINGVAVENIARGCLLSCNLLYRGL